MSEGGVVEGILGGAEEEEQKAAQRALGTEAVAGTLATVVAMDGARYDEELSRTASNYLKQQHALVEASANLLRIQAGHMDEELRLTIEAAKRKRFSDHFRMGFQVFAALLAGAVGVGTVLMVWEAATSRNVVVNAFDAAPALAAQGLTGKVVATRVLDALEELQSATRAAGTALGAKTAWSSDVKIEVPETGISIGEVNHVLHERLGHDIHINGDIDLSKAGQATLVVRGEGIPAAHFSGPVEELDKLVTQGAEYIYGRSQAVRYATYLTNARRFDEAQAFIAAAMPRATADEAAELAALWGNSLATQGKMRESIQKYRLALAIKPHMWRAWGNIVSSLMYSDSEEAAARESDAMLKAAAEDSYNTADHLEFQNSWIIARDFPALIRAFMSNAEQNHGVGTAVSLAGPSLADAYDNLHDFSSARKWLAKSDPDDDVTKAQNLLQQVYEGLESGQAAQALEPARRFWDLWLATEVLQNDAFSDQACMVGLVYGLNGDLASAEEVFRKNRPWSYCYAAHGDVLEHAGQLAAAEKVWADGLRAAPRMSPVYLHRGIAELKRGDYRRAEADLAAASERSPHWADPLKAWGDLLARQGRWKEALAKYQAALAYAPNWPALRAARDAAQSKGG